MPSQDKFFQLLNDGNWHSGQALADSLGVSRTVVWKQIEKLRAKGFEIEASSGKGYRLQSRQASLFNESLLKEHINADVLTAIDQIVVADSIGSTNDECLKQVNAQIQEQSEDQKQDSVLVVAEQQTSGRGRRGKQWYSPYASNLYMSFSQRFDQGVASLSGLSLVVGIAVANVLVRNGLQDARLKWPNDIQVANKKLGGILLELTGEIAGPCYAIMGIGLNLNMPADAGQAVDQPYTDLISAAPAGSWEKNGLAADIVNELCEVTQVFRQRGFAPFLSLWMERDAYLGQDVIISSASSRVDSGIHTGVNTDGSILLKTAEGLKPFSGGEISLRLQNKIEGK